MESDLKHGGAVLLAPLLACGGAPSAPEWVSLGKSDDGTRECFVDVSNIRIAGSIRSTWVKFDNATRTHTVRDLCGIGVEDFPKPNKFLDSWVASHVACMSFNCATKQASVGKITDYFEDGEQHTETLPTPWSDVAPGTKLESTMNFVCAWKPK